MNGIPLFLTQLVSRLQTVSGASNADIGESATKHGDDLLQMGFTVGQVVHDYGGLCQAITELAVEDNVPISNSEFKTLNGCLDDAIASAVSEFSRQREKTVSDDGNAQLGILTHELRNALQAATIAFEVLRSGAVGATGSTSAILARNLDSMRHIIDRSLAAVRLEAGPQKRPVMVASLIEEVAIGAEIEARHTHRQFTVGPVTGDVTIHVDPHLLVSALTNLLQNAFKFTRPGGNVSLQTVVSADRVRIEIEDECGGLPAGKVEDLFRMFEQRGADRSGLGLGLAITRKAVVENGGTIAARDRPGQGCVFSVDLPRET